MKHTTTESHNEVHVLILCGRISHKKQCFQIGHGYEQSHLPVSLRLSLQLCLTHPLSLKHGFCFAHVFFFFKSTYIASLWREVRSAVSMCSNVRMTMNAASKCPVATEHTSMGLLKLSMVCTYELNLASFPGHVTWERG